ncbi:hypothetical protein TELCIR_11531, partial [Teladorsagia circumcincta]
VLIMPESPPPPHDFRDHKQHMEWLIEREKYAANTVPMIPRDFSKGSHSKAISSTVLQRALANPFVPVGMAATVGCLIGLKPEGVGVPPEDHPSSFSSEMNKI